MVNQYTPLVAQDEDVYYEEYVEDSIVPSWIADNVWMKFLATVIVGVAVVVIVYVMCVVVPGGIPDGVRVPDITMVKDVGVYLHPVHVDEYVDDDDVVWSKQLLKLQRDPQFMEKSRRKRLIIVGDVHGSISQLKRFLKKVKYDGGVEDHVLLLGDFLNKGKDSVGTLNYIIENKIDCILGNHEIAMLKRYCQLHGVKAPVFVNKDDAPDSTLTIRESYKLDDLMKLAKRLTAEHISFLSNLAVIKTLGPVPHYTDGKRVGETLAEYPANGIAVHAGLMWNKGLHEQDVEEVTTVRNLLPPDWKTPTPDRTTSNDGLKSRAWSKVWNSHQRDVYERYSGDDGSIGVAEKIYYGHDARRGVSMREYSNGLDSGCVYGKKLSGVVIWAEVDSDVKKVVYKQELVQVKY